MTVAAIPNSSKAAATAAIHFASGHNGIDFNYLLAQAKTESGLDPRAAASTSTARGLFQFTQGTWLETIRKHGAKNGLGWAAGAIAGHSDPATRAAVLDLRNDPVAAAAMAASYAADNAAKLATGLGRVATSTDLYLAHFLGAAGALRFLKAKTADPEKSAAAVAPAAARANRRVFFTADGEPRSVQAVHDHFAAIFGGRSVPPTGTDLPVTRAPLVQLATDRPTPPAPPI